MVEGEWRLNRGSCPVEKGVPVDVQYRDSTVQFDVPALLNGRDCGMWPCATDWGLGGADHDIILWRPSRRLQEILERI